MGSVALPARRLAGGRYADGRRGDSTSLATGSLLFDHSFRARGEVLRRYDAMAARLRLIGGATVAYDQIDTVNPAGQQTILDARHTGHQVGAFGQADYNIGSRAKVMGALRVDDASTYSVQASPKVAVALTVARDQTIRVGYGHAFQPATCTVSLYPRVALAPPVALGALEAALAPVVGGVDLQFDAVPVLALGNTALKPEHVDGIEVGYSGVVRRQWLFTVDVYRSRVSSFISGFLPQVGTSLGRINPQYGPYQPPSSLNAVQQAIVVGTLGAVLPLSLFAVMSNDRDGAPIFAALSSHQLRVGDRGGASTCRHGDFPARHWTAELSYSHFNFDVQRDLPDQPLTANTAPNRVSAAVSYRGRPPPSPCGIAGPMRFCGRQVSSEGTSRPTPCSTCRPRSAWADTTRSTERRKYPRQQALRAVRRRSVAAPRCRRSDLSLVVSPVRDHLTHCRSAAFLRHAGEDAAEPRQILLAIGVDVDHIDISSAAALPVSEKSPNMFDRKCDRMCSRRMSR